MFGGTVNGKYLSIAYCNDDGLDFDHGYNGLLQYVSIIQHGNGNSNCAIEWDGAAKDDKGNTSTGAPEYSQPTIMNLTAIGSGSISDSSKSKGMDIRDNGGGYVLNSIFTEFPNGILKVEKTKSSKGSNDGSANPTSSGSQYLLEQNILGFFGNIFYQGDEAADNNEDAVVADSEKNGESKDESGNVTFAGNTAAEVKAVAFAATSSNDADVSPALINANLENGPIMPFPSSSSPALNGAVDISSYQQDGFFDVVAYQGAFASDAPADNWLAGWTAVSNPFNVAIGSTSSSSSSSSSIKLKGISTNATVSPSALMVAGVTITCGTKKVVFQVQATGTYPALAGYLTDPVLTITKGQTVIAVVDNWKTGPTSAVDSTYYQTSYLTELQNSAYAMRGDNESAIILDLPEGSYTALVSSASGTETAPAVVAAFEFE